MGPFATEPIVWFAETWDVMRYVEVYRSKMNRVLSSGTRVSSTSTESNLGSVHHLPCFSPNFDSTSTIHIVHHPYMAIRLLRPSHRHLEAITRITASPRPIMSAAASNSTPASTPNKTAHAFDKTNFDAILSRRFFFIPSFEIYGGGSTKGVADVRCRRAVRLWSAWFCSPSQHPGRMEKALHHRRGHVGARHDNHDAVGCAQDVRARRQVSIVVAPLTLGLPTGWSRIARLARSSVRTTLSRL